MTTAALPEQPHRPGCRPAARARRLTPLATAAAVLSTAVVVLPFPLAAASAGGRYAGPEALREAVTAGFVRFWAGGGATVGPDLAAAADFWARFHVVKAGLAAALLAVLLLLLPRLWRSSTEAEGRPRRWGLRALLASTASLLVLSVLVLVANVQGALAPLSSVLGVLPLGAPRGELAATANAAADAVTVASPAPQASALLDDFARYHAVMAGLGVVVTVVLLASAGLVLRRRARLPLADRATRRALVAGTAGLLALAAFFAVVTAANVGTARHPAAALAAFLGGGA